jgi:hypothetical protein
MSVATQPTSRRHPDSAPFIRPCRIAVPPHQGPSGPWALTAAAFTNPADHGRVVCGHFPAPSCSVQTTAKSRNPIPFSVTSVSPWPMSALLPPAASRLCQSHLSCLPPSNLQIAANSSKIRAIDHNPTTLRAVHAFLAVSSPMQKPGRTREPFLRPAAPTPRAPAKPAVSGAQAIRPKCP